MEGEGNEEPAGTARPEASLPSKPFLLSTQTEGRTSRSGGWSQTADWLTIGRVTRAARGEGAQIRLQYSQPLGSHSWDRWGHSWAEKQ